MHAARHHPVARAQLERREVVDGVFEDEACIAPLAGVFVEAEGAEFEALAEKTRRFIERGECEQFAITFPEAARDPAHAFVRACAVVRRIGAGVRRDGRHELRRVPFQAIGTGRELHSLAHTILDARSIAPHRPELAVVMREVVVLVHATSFFVEPWSDRSP